MALYVPFFSPKEKELFSKLEEQRVALLSQIASISQATGDEAKPEHIRSFKNQYNDVVEKKINTHRGPLSDPLTTLPIELFILLVKEIISRRDGTSTKDLLTLSLVNSQWRRALVSEPTLWTDIAIGNGLKDTEVLPRVYTGLVLSGNQPIHLAIDHPAPDWREHIVPILRPHASRVRSLIIWPPSSTKLAEEAPTDDVTICEILHSLGPLPNLRQLELESKYRVNELEFTNFLNSAPNIRSITGDHLTFHQVNDCVSHEMETFTTFATLDQLLTVLPRFSRLTTLILEDLSDEEPVFRHSNSSLMTQLPLQSLNYRQSPADNLPKLISITPNLDDIGITITWKILAEILPLMRDFRLRNFALYIKCKGPWEDIFQPLDVPHFQGLKSFTFHLHGRQDSRESEAEKVERLFCIIHSSISLQKAIFVTDRRHISLEVIKTLSNLRDLTLDAIKMEGIESLSCLQQRHLESLTLYLSPHLIYKIVNTLQYPNLVSLDLACEDKLWPLGDREFDINPRNQLSSLYSIEWGLKGVKWHTTSLPSLRIIKFKDRTLQATSDFCVSMILRPHDCPSLEQVEFLQYPEWDLLYIMLERRNFLHDSSVCPIRLVSMPSSIGLVLRQPLNGLLRGRFVNRGSNQDVSLAAICEAYFDPSLAGCHFCHMSLNCCSEPISIGVTHMQVDFLLKKLIARQDLTTANPPLTEEEYLWLEKRQERYDIWNRLIDEEMMRFRPYVCEKHELGWSYLSTGFSFAGQHSRSAIIFYVGN
ncbi:hypothetical protein FRC16_000304 [Serendipita sp. 398]|nr:hypothetical protein FRC16_000304 [Serendipita sp. 398]